MLTAITEVILPVLLIAGVGALVGRIFKIDQAGLNKLQLYVLVPTLAYSSLMKMAIPPGAILHLGAVYFAVSAVVGVLAYLAGTGLPWRERGPIVASTVIGNNGNFGLPIALLALGQPGLDNAIVIFIFSLIIMWTLGPAVLGSHAGVVPVLKAIGRLPTIWAVLLAGGMRTLGLRFPTGVMTAVDMIADASVPMVLLGLGIQLGTMGTIRLTRPVLTAAILRIVAVPLVAWGLGAAMGLHGVPLQSLVLACAMPTAVNVLMIAWEYGADAEAAASAVALSTFASVATLTLVVSNLGLFA